LAASQEGLSSIKLVKNTYMATVLTCGRSQIKPFQVIMNLKKSAIIIGPRDPAQNFVAHNYMHMHALAMMQRTRQSKHSAAASCNVPYLSIQIRNPASFITS
jgi:hypothetical protein